MYSLFLIAFVVCLLVNYVQDGGQFIVFSRVVEFANSFREATPRSAKRHHNALGIEYKFGHKLFCVLLPRLKPLPWVQAAAMIDGQWVNKTQEIYYYAGPFKNFYGIPLTPEHIDSSWEKLAFRFENDTVVHVQPKEVILAKLKIAMKARMRPVKKEVII